MSRIKEIWETRPRPISAGVGYVFIEVGQLICDGDEYFNHNGEWKPTTLRRKVCAVDMKHLYRRRIAA